VIAYLLHPRQPSRSFSIRLLVVALLAAFGVSAVRAEDRPRFEALLADGTRIEGDNLTGWHTADGRPELNDRPLLSADNPMRWLRDRENSPPSPPSAFVETWCGDRLPGEVVGFQSTDAASFASLPDHFVVRPDEALRLRPTSDDVQIRVVARYVRRIVFQRRNSQAFEPGTAFFRDGRSAKFRAVRFAGASVSLLLDDGPQRASYSELAEIHLPIENFWDRYFDELAVLCADGESRLLQIETTAGLVATASLARLAVEVRGNPQDFTRWVHGVQPAWSLDVLWIYNGDIWLRRSFAPHETPLARLLPEPPQQQSLLSGAGFAPQFGRNVAGGPLRSGGADFGGGIGVHASCRLIFTLPDCARSFQARVGIDAASGEGGCIRARVYAGGIDDPLFESDYLVGSESVADTGALSLVHDGKPAKSLVLEIDPAHDGRPAGADPFDIRDAADWLDPRLTLDAEQVKTEIADRAARQIEAWNGWTVETSEKSGLRCLSYWEPSAGEDGAFLVGTLAEGEGFALRRRYQLSRSDNWLVLMAHRRAGGEPVPQLEVRVDGEPAGQYEVPLQSGGSSDAPPIAVPLTPFQAAGGEDHEVEIEVRQLPGRPNSPVFWSALRLTEHLPTLFQLFEDRDAAQFVAAAGGDAVASLEKEQAHSGAASLKITAGGRFRRTFDERIPIRRDPQWGEYRHLRFAFRKSGEGRISIELEHERSADRPARYDAGLGDPCQGEAKRVWVNRLPEEWIVITRDLYAEFGEIDVTGLVLGVPDGEYALFDHIYLGRTPTDLDDIPAATAAEDANAHARREVVRPLLEKVRRAMLAIDFGEGRHGSGVLVSKDGWALTSGHLAIGPKRKLTARLADGSELEGVTHGVSRDFDLAMIKLQGANDLPNLPISDAKSLADDAIYVAGYHAASAPEDEAELQIVQLRRVYRGALWCTLNADDADTGGPLVDQQGRLLGVYYHRDKFGRALFARTVKDDELLSTLRGDGVWGRWQPGTGPVIGISGTPKNEGLHIDTVEENSPAAKAGLKPGDIVQKCDGHSLVSHNDLDRLLSEKNAGDEVTLDVLRAGEMLEVRVHLAPRVP
jgi:S1-C subfamily serine protease